ncbi:MAG: ATP-binding protein [Bacteroidota bacterium]
MVDRIIATKIIEASTQMPVVAITGPRQSGKSTLVRNYFTNYTYTNLEDLELRQFAQEDPKGFLENIGEKAIIDEIQQVPSLLSYIQVIVDRNNLPGQYILSGSQNLLLMEGISQSLAGRVSIFNLLPFSIEELKNTKYHLSDYEDYIFKGFYPRIYDQSLSPNSWLLNYIQTYVERDLRQLINVLDLGIFRQFLAVCAGRIGQLVNFSDISNVLGISYQTVKRWLSILETSFIIYQLRPYHKNYNKRIVKSPKLYFYDTGLACALLNILSVEDLNRHFAKGALFENFIINEIIKNHYNRSIPIQPYFSSFV